MPFAIIDQDQQQELNRWQLQDFSAKHKLNGRSEDKVVIVCGCGRSGTTLLRVMLDSHSQISCGPESLLFLPVPVNLASLAKKFNLSIASLQKMHLDSKDRANFIEKFSRACLVSTGKTIWADKTARNIHNIDSIIKAFPNAMIIHVVRDGRDVVSSLITHKKRKVVGDQLAATHYIMPLEECIKRWNLAISDGKKFRDHKNYCEVRYEDLVLHTTDTLKKVCNFIGIAYEAKMEKYYTQKTHSRDIKNFPQNVEATFPINTSSIGRWRFDLSTTELRTVEQEAQENLTFLKYENYVPQIATREVSLVDATKVEQAIGNDVLFVKQSVLESLKLYHKGQKLTQPSKIYMQRNESAHRADRIITMPVYIDDERGFAGVKWIGSHPENPRIGLNRASALIILNDTKTNLPIAILDGTLISSFRTLAISLIAIDRFCFKPKQIACLGMGKLGKMHASFLPNIYETIEKVYCFGHSDYDDVLSEKVVKCEDYQSAIINADVVITTTTANQPYIAASDVKDNQLLINLSLMDFSLDVFQKADHVIVDNFEQCCLAKKVFKSGVDSGILKKENVVEITDFLFGKRSDQKISGLIMFNPLGMAIEDIVLARDVFQRASFMPLNKFYMDNKQSTFFNEKPNKPEIFTKEVIQESVGDQSHQPSQVSFWSIPRIIMASAVAGATIGALACYSVSSRR